MNIKVAHTRPKSLIYTISVFYKFPVSTVLLYYNSLYLNRSTRYSTSYSLYLNKLLTLPQQSTSYSLYLNSQQATRSTSTVNSSTSYNSDNNDN